MHNPVKLFFALVLMIAISSCVTLTKEDTNKWLKSKNGEAGINMTGRWDSGGLATGGWGEGNFIQEGSRISGTLGLYYVSGVVIDEKVYMAISSGNKVYYTARLKKQPDGTITGKAVESKIIDSPEAENADSYLISLVKIK